MNRDLSEVYKLYFKGETLEAKALDGSDPIEVDNLSLIVGAFIPKKISKKEDYQPTMVDRMPDFLSKFIRTFVPKKYSAGEKYLSTVVDRMPDTLNAYFVLEELREVDVVQYFFLMKE